MEPLYGGIDSLYLNNLRKEKAGLESLVRLNPTLDSNIFDFLLYAGWDARYRSPIYMDHWKKGQKHGGEDAEYVRLVDDYMSGRKGFVSQEERGRETRCMNALLGHCRDKRISGVYDFVANKGIWLPQCGVKSLGTLNGTLMKYGFSPLAVGRPFRGKYNPIVKGDVLRYGMIPLEK